jgi:hypothetical protein
MVQPQQQALPRQQANYHQDSNKARGWSMTLVLVRG